MDELGSRSAGIKETVAGWIPMIFMFNIMVGTGLLAIPRIFYASGLGLGTAFFCLVCLLAAITHTYLAEALGAASAVVKKRNEYLDQIGSFHAVLMPQAASAVWYFVITLYLVGALAIYAVFIPETVATVLPAASVGLKSFDEVYRVTLLVLGVVMIVLMCFNFTSTTWLQIITTVIRHAVLLAMISVAFMAASGDGPAAHGKNTSLPDGHGAILADVSGLSLLVSGATYSVISAQYHGGFFAPMKHKKSSMIPVLTGAHVGVAIYSLLLCWSAQYAFADAADPGDAQCPQGVKCTPRSPYTLTFEFIQPAWLGNFIIIAPAIGLCGSYPLIGILLRDNAMMLMNILGRTHWGRACLSSLCCVSQRRRPSQGIALLEAGGSLQTQPDGSMPRASDAGEDATTELVASLKEPTTAPLWLRAVFALAMGVLPVLLAFLTRNVETIVRFTGGYGGCYIMFVMPTLLMIWSRGGPRKYFGQLCGRRDGGDGAKALPWEPDMHAEMDSQHSDGGLYKSHFGHPLIAAGVLLFALMAAVFNTLSLAGVA